MKNSILVFFFKMGLFFLNVRFVWIFFQKMYESYGLYGFSPKNSTDCTDLFWKCTDYSKKFWPPLNCECLTLLILSFPVMVLFSVQWTNFFLYLIWHRQQHFLSFKKIYMLQRQIKCNNLLYKFINVEELSWIRSQNSGIDILVWKEFIYYFF